MKNDYIYVFTGSGSRYTLRPFADYIRKQGDLVVELDTEDEGCLRQIQEIQGKKIVYITSDHLGLDRENMRFLINGKFSLANLELMGSLKPIKSILYTHDLGKIVGGWEEQRYLDLFDIVLFPYICNDYYFASRSKNVVEEIGWIKKKKNFRRNVSDGTVAYFPSNIDVSIAHYGEMGYAGWIEDMIDKSVSVKPHPFAGMQPVSKILKEKGYTIVKSSFNVFDVMETTELIVTNGCSSVVYEAAYSGCPVISVLDGFSPDELYIKEKPQAKWVYTMYPKDVMPFIDKIRKGEEILEKGKDILKPFDYKKAYQLVSG